MNRLTGTSICRAVVTGVLALCATMMLWTRCGSAYGDPPEGQTYMGAKKCASCHFKQYMVWKKDKHATAAFKNLASKYKKKADCLKCHTTGYGEPSGYKGAKTPSLAGVTCEACHGAGSKHAEIAEGFGKKKLSEDQEKEVRGSIWKLKPGNVCISCHTSKAHGKHPKYDK